MTKTIDIGADFSPKVGGRFRKDGPFSGEKFRDEVLIPALNEADKVNISLDSIAGYSPSFFEEAFGGLVRELGPAVIARLGFVTTSRQYLVAKIARNMNEAVGEIQRS